MTESVQGSTVLVYDRKDLLPQQWMLAAFGEPATLAGHLLPSYSGYMACCLNSAGWGMMPRFSVENHIEDGTLVELVPGATVTVPLFWQSSGPGSEIMKILTTTVTDVARKHLLALPDHAVNVQGARAPAG